MRVVGLDGVELARVALRVGVDSVAGDDRELVDVAALGVTDQDSVLTALLEAVVLDSVEVRSRAEPQRDLVAPVRAWSASARRRRG